jgi:hypothetical protein
MLLAKIRCKAVVNVRYIDGERDYSKKNNWDYWTESKPEKNNPRYLCDECLLELFYRHKAEFRQWVKNKKRRNLLGVYINEGVIGSRKPFFE